MTEREKCIGAIRYVASRLGQLRDLAVFFGGAVTAVLLTDSAAPDVRPTNDVDVLIEARSFAEEAKLDDELRGLGFRHDTTQGAPIFRWVVADCVVDVVYVGTCSDRWSGPAVDSAVRLDLGEGLAIRHVSAPYFVAMKIEAFHDRGEGNYAYSRDIADVIQVVDCRPELTVELATCESAVIDYISAQFRRMLDDPNFVDAITYHLPSDAASQARAPLIVERMSEMARGDL